MIEQRRHLFAIYALMWVLPLMTAGRSDAQPAQSFDELIAGNRLSGGAVIIVRDASGRETKGVFNDFRNEALVLLDGKRGFEQSFVEADVNQIRRAGGQAAGWGALLGGSVGFVATYAAASKYGENEGGKVCSRCLVQWGAFAVPAGAGIGALVGLGIERKQREILYLAPRPVRSVVAIPWVSPSRAGVLVSVRF